MAMLRRCILWSGLGLVVSFVLSDAAHSQVFLIASEKAIIQFMENKPRIKDAIPLIQFLVNFFRLVFAVYILYSVMGTFQAVQRDESWIKPVSPVLFLLIVTFVMDLLVPLVVK